MLNGRIKTGVLFMKTEIPTNEIIESLDKEILRREKSISMEIPLQQMFDEMLVFISKTDFE